MISEGDILRLEIKKAKVKQEDFAGRMGFSRNYLLRLLSQANLPEDVKIRACKELNIDIEKIFGVQMQTISEPVEEYSTQIQIIDEKDLHPIMRKYIRELEESNQVLKRVISLQDEKIERLENH